jgi:outer membrane protein
VSAAASRRVRRRRRCQATVGVVLALLLTGAVAGDSLPHGELRHLLAAVGDHPGLRAAAAAGEAARLRSEAVRQPLGLSLSYEAQRLVVEPASDPLPPPFDELFGIDERSDSYSVTALLRPFLAGDLRDLGDQRRLELERADLTLRETRAGLEAQAVSAAAGALLAERGVALAEAALRLAERSAAATELRAAQGAATELERRRATLQLEDAERGLRAAVRQRDAALDGLARLAGDARLSGVPELSPVVAVPPDLLRTLLDLELAEVGLRSQGRALLPTIQAGYTWLLADDGGSVTIGLESRTFQPSLRYASDSGAGAGGLGDLRGLLPDGVAPTVRGAFSIGVSWTISPQALMERDASALQVEAAAAALASAHDRAALTYRSLRSGLDAADELVTLAELERDLASGELEAAEARYAAGLIGELELERARFAGDRAEVELLRARVERLAAVLDTYVTYAVPLSEVLP